MAISQFAGGASSFTRGLLQQRERSRLRKIQEREIALREEANRRADDANFRARRAAVLSSAFQAGGPEGMRRLIASRPDMFPDLSQQQFGITQEEQINSSNLANAATKRRQSQENRSAALGALGSGEELDPRIAGFSGALGKIPDDRLAASLLTGQTVGFRPQQAPLRGMDAAAVGIFRDLQSGDPERRTAAEARLADLEAVRRATAGGFKPDPLGERRMAILEDLGSEDPAVVKRANRDLEDLDRVARAGRATNPFAGLGFDGGAGGIDPGLEDLQSSINQNLDILASGSEEEAAAALQSLVTDAPQFWNAIGVPEDQVEQGISELQAGFANRFPSDPGGSAAAAGPGPAAAPPSEAPPLPDAAFTGEREPRVRYRPEAVEAFKQAGEFFRVIQGLRTGAVSPEEAAAAFRGQGQSGEESR